MPYTSIDKDDLRRGALRQRFDVILVPSFGGSAETGSVSCPPSPSPTNPCTITIKVSTADVGGPTSKSLLEEVGSYSFASAHPQGALTNAQALADDVPLEIDGACCFNFKGG